MTAEKVCITLRDENWRRRDHDWGGARVQVIHSEDDIDNEFYDLHFTEKFTEPSRRQIRATNPEKVADIAGWLTTLTARYGIPGWVIGKGTMCHMSDDRAAAEGIKNIKHRRKLVYSICVEEVNPHEPKPCGNPIYEHGLDCCSIHSRQKAKEAQEREMRRAAREEAAARVAIEEAEDEYVNETATNALCVASACAGVPYTRDVVKWGKRKGELGFADISIHRYTDRTRRSINLDLDMFIAICSKLTGETIEILPPAAGDLLSTEPQALQSAVAGDVQNPFA